MENASFDEIDDKLQDHETRMDTVEAWKTSTTTALSTGLRKRVTSDANRLVQFPSPVQGDIAERTDKPYFERYYTAYNATTNPHGVTTAGWYPFGPGRPSCYVYKASAQAQTIVPGTNQMVTWSSPITNAEGYDPFAFWNASAPSRLTAPVTGVYLAKFKVRTNGVIAIDATGYRSGAIYERIHGSATGASGASSSVYAEGEIRLTAGQYVELQLNSEGGNYIVRADAQSTWATLEYVRPF